MTSKYQWLYFDIYQTARNQIGYCLSPTASFVWFCNLVLSSYCLRLSAQAEKGAAGAICQRIEELLLVIIKALPTDNSAAYSCVLMNEPLIRMLLRPLTIVVCKQCKPWNNRDLNQAPVSGCDRRVESRSVPQ